MVKVNYFFSYSLYWITNIDLCNALIIDPNDISIEVILLLSISGYKLSVFPW